MCTSGLSIDSLICNNNAVSGLYLSGSKVSLRDIVGYDSQNAGITITTGSEALGTGIDLQRNGVAISGASLRDAVVLFGSSANNATLGAPGGSIESYCLRNWVSSGDAALISVSTGQHNQVYFERFGNTNDDHRIYAENCLIQTATDQRHTAADYAWKCVISSASARPATYPVVISLGRYPVVASGLVTAKLWVRRDDAGAFVALLCDGGQLPGVSADVSTTISASINTWQQINITFTPTQAGFIELSASFWATVANKTTWIDDLEFSQDGGLTVPNGLNTVHNGRIVAPTSVVSAGSSQSASGFII